MGAKLRFAGTGDTRVKNGIAIDVAAEKKEYYTLSRLVHSVIFQTLKVRREDIFCLQDPRGKRYTLILSSLNACYNLVSMVKANLDNPNLDGLIFTVLYNDNVPLVVSMYNPFVPVEDITVFLRRYCVFLSEHHKVLNEESLWTGKYKFFVKFREDPDGELGFKYPPRNFSIGRDRGYLFFPQPPVFCRKCKIYGHSLEHCTRTADMCSKCNKEGHLAKDCQNLIVCNVCGLEGHAFKDCPVRPKNKRPRAYSEVVSGEIARTAVEEVPAQVEPLPAVLEEAEKSDARKGEEAEMEVAPVVESLPLPSDAQTGLQGEGETDNSLARTPVICWSDVMEAKEEGRGQGDFFSSDQRSLDHDEGQSPKRLKSVMSPASEGMVSPDRGTYPTSLFSVDTPFLEVTTNSIFISSCQPPEGEG